MTPAAHLFAQAHEPPPAHLLIVAFLATIALVGWLLYRVARRRGDERPSAPASGRPGPTGSAWEGDDHA